MMMDMDFKNIALAFANALSERNYEEAHGLMSKALRKSMTADELREAFEDIVPTDWGPIGPVEVGETMADWPGKEPGDEGWAYVSIGGGMYSEAVIVIVARQGDVSTIRDVEWGRP